MFNRQIAYRFVYRGNYGNFTFNWKWLGVIVEISIRSKRNIFFFLHFEVLFCIFTTFLNLGLARIQHLVEKGKEKKQKENKGPFITFMPVTYHQVKISS